MRSPILIAAAVAVAAAVLTACPGKSEGPLPPDQLAPFQACALPSDCVLARNQPRECCGDTTFDNVVVVSKAKISEFEQQFEAPSCDGLLRCPPPIDDAVLENRFEVSCMNSACTIAQEHLDTGRSCSDDLPCPANYVCVDQPNGDSVCFYEPALESCSRAIESPLTPERPIDPAVPDFGRCRDGWNTKLGPGDGSHCDPWTNNVERTCGEAGADFPDADELCAQILVPCGAGGRPIDLPNDGTPILFVPSGSSIAAAIDVAVDGTIIATSTGAYVESLSIVNKDVTLWGCGESTELNGEISVVGANVRVRNLIVRGSIESAGTGETTVERVLISGSAGSGWILHNGATGIGRMLIVRAAAEHGISLASGATLDLQQGALDGNEMYGLLVSDAESHAMLEDVVASRNGLAGISAASRGSILANGIALERNLYAGLYARDDGAIEASDAFTTTTALTEPDGPNGYGAIATSGSRITIRRAYFERNRNASIIASGLASSIIVEDTIVETTLSAMGRPAAGIAAQDGASVDVLRAGVHGSGAAAVTVSGESSRALIMDLDIFGVRVETPTTAAIAVFDGGDLELDRGRVRNVEGAGAIVSDLGSKCVLRVVRFESLAEGGLYANGGARLEAEIVSVAAAHHAGAYVSGEATSAKLEALTISDVLPIKNNGPGGVGLAVDGGASVEGNKLSVSGVHHAGVFVTGLGTSAILENVEVSGTAASRFDQTAGRGVSVESGATAELHVAVLSANRQVGLLAISPETSVIADDVRIEGTVAGIGAASYGGASLTLDRFIIENNELAGGVRGSSSTLSFGAGRIESNPLGLSVEGAIALDQVCFQGNDDDVATSDLGLPAAVELD